MDAKYYTPTIEEFHVGFEYEEGDDQFGWESEQVTLGGDFDYYDDFIREGRIRVKHLDRDDIEECGWESDSVSSDWTCFHLKSESKYNHALSIDLGHKKPFGTSVKIWNNEKTLFDGTMRNKSELKKLMKIFGVNGNG